MQTRLSEEYDRCREYMDGSTRKPLIQAVEQQLLSRHVAQVLEKGFVQLMDQHRCARGTWHTSRCVPRFHSIAAIDAIFVTHRKRWHELLYWCAEEAEGVWQG